MTSGKQKRWLSILLTVGTLAVGLGAVLLANSSEAGQVGVAAAVKPDAFSGGSEIKIGESVFYNQRINTSGEGLVQVLLVDGSTFTVGPGSDLVIDKFVYDPNKGKGEVVASFSKGVMRFVGGKISKNEGGVTVNTPSGALAIRGGMFQGTPNLFSFLFGVEMKFTGKNGIVNRVYQPGYTLDLKGGVANIRPTTARDTAFFMKALSGGGKVVVAAPNGPKVKPGLGFLKSAYINEIEQEGTQTIIIGQLANQEGNNPNPPTPSGVIKGGYAGGIFTQTGNNDDVPVGSLANCHCTEIVVTYDKKTNTFSGAKFVLYADQGGGLKIKFEPYEIDILGDSQPNQESLTNYHADDLVDGLVAVGHASVSADNPNIGAISVYHDLNRAGQLSNPASQVNGTAYLYSGSGVLLCENCGFIKWGAWTTDVSFDNESGDDGQTHVNAIGFWVAGNMTSTADLGDLRNSGATASYSGKAWAGVANNLDGEGWSKYNASGNMDMNWSFGRRKGNLTISNFDAQHFDGGLNFSGKMKTPGQVAQNLFTGPLSLNTPNLPANLSGVQGFAQGSFVKGANSRVQGVIGNWGVGNDAYKATGIFAGGKGVPQ